MNKVSLANFVQSISVLYSDSCFCFMLRNARERIMGPNKETVGSGQDLRKSDMYASDSVFEETIIAEYALIINGHSLVRSLMCCSFSTKA